MDQLRARAFLDLLLGKDSRPRRDSGSDGGGPGPEGPDAPPPSPGPAGGAVPAGFAGRVALTVPLATVTGLASRPGEIPGIGPVDPKPEANTLNRYRTERCADRRGGSGIDVLRQRRRARPSSVAASHVLARVKVMIMPWAALCT